MLRLSSRVWGPLSRPPSALFKGSAPHSVAATAETQDSEWINAKPFDHIPGPRPLPLIGNAWRYFPLIGEYHNLKMVDLFSKYHEQYGDIVRITGLPGTPNTLYVYDPDIVEKILRNEGRWPSRDFTPSFTYYRMVTRKDLFQGMGGVLAAQGEEWQKQRTKVNPALMQPRSTRLYVNRIDEVAQEFVDKMKKMRDDKDEMPAHFENEVSKWALESITLVALDKRMGCLADNLDKDSEQQQIIHAAGEMLDCMYLLDVSVSYWKYISTPTWRRFVRNNDCFTEVAFKYVHEAAERVKTMSRDSDRELSVLEKLLLSEADPKLAVVTALDLMFGGIDTTTSALNIVLYYLAKNPEKQEKLYQETRKFLPSSPQEPLTAEKLEDMKYLKACVKESMRISPPAFGNGRTLLTDLVLANYQVPKNTNVFLMHMFMSNSEKYFPQADKFIPERWLKGPNGEPPQAKETHPFVYMPFGFGIRMCLGRRFAELEIHSLVARIIRNFQIEYNYPMTFTHRMLLRCGSPLKFKIVDRNKLY